ncbi:MAG: hypothetical protein NVS4B10_15010 [Myxococcales bacterium]
MMLNLLEAGSLTLKSRSVAVAETACAPSASVAGGARFQRPSGPTCAVYATPSRVTCTEVSGEVRPEIIGWLSCTSAPGTGDSMVGGAGTASDTVTETGVAGAEVFPAGSVATAVMRVVPSGMSADGTQLKAPAPFAAAPHSGAPLPASLTTTVLPASAVPLITGLRLRVGEAGRSSTGAAGGVVRTTRDRAALGAEECPRPSFSCAAIR